MGTHFNMDEETTQQFPRGEYAHGGNVSGAIAELRLMWTKALKYVGGSPAKKISKLKITLEDDQK